MYLLLNAISVTLSFVPRLGYMEFQRYGD